MNTRHVLGLTDRELADFVTTPARIVAIVAGALVLRWLIGRAITRFVRSTSEGRISRRLMAIGEHAQVLVDMSATAVSRREQRAASVGTVLRSVTSAVIFAVATTIVLGELGIDIAPIIASAGIIGVAVGFGAQNLVKDFLSGLFLVVEDTYGVGDTVDLGPATGTVEWIGLRSTRIRDVHGTLWSVRNGAINAVGNFSQAWQRAIFDVTVLHGQDVTLARDTMLATAEALCDEAAFVDVVLEPPAVWGVNEIRPDGVVVRLVVRRRNGNDAFDRALRERLVADLGSAGVRIFVLPVAFDPQVNGLAYDVELGRPGAGARGKSAAGGRGPSAGGAGGAGGAGAPATKVPNRRAAGTPAPVKAASRRTARRREQA